MEKIKKYDRIYRICPKILKGISGNLLINVADSPKRKKCFNQAEIDLLLDGNTIFEEKIDGGVVGISWTGDHHLAVGKHSMIHYSDNSKKFYGLNSWIYANYEKIQRIPLGWIIYGEWVRARHNISYDKLPDYFISFDIWDGYRYIDHRSRSEFLHKLGFAEVPYICSGNNIDIEEILRIAEGINISNKSKFSSTETFEGVVIKNYEKGLMGKYVRREFIDSIEKNWLRLPLIENKLVCMGNRHG